MNEPLLSELEAHYQTWRQLMRATGPTDRVQAAAAIKTLYTAEGRPAPAIIHCQSPFQLALLPSLLHTTLASAEWNEIRKRIAQQGPDHWRRREEWARGWLRLWCHTLEPLLNSMLMSDVSDFADYALLVQPLANSLRAALRSQLFSPEAPLTQLETSPRMENWWHLTSESTDGPERVYRLECELGKLYGHNPTVRQHNLDNDLLANFWRLNLATQRSETSMRTVARGMGKKVDKQLLRCVWLPFALHWVPGFLAIDELAIFEKSKSARAAAKAAQTEASMLMRPWWILANSAGPVLFVNDICFVCDRPTQMYTDEEGVLHNPQGAALVYPDGFRRYLWHGTVVPASLIEHPDSVTVETIDKETNIEMRRVFAELYGLSRYLMDSNAEVVHQDECGVLYRKVMGQGEPLVMVKVINATAEPDGSHREFFIRVPPHIQRARQAVAWTFGLREEEYFPSTQS